MQCAISLRHHYWQSDSHRIFSMSETELLTFALESASARGFPKMILYHSRLLFSSHIQSAKKSHCSPLQNSSRFPTLLLDSPYHCSGSRLNLWNSAPFTVKLSIYEENLTVLLLFFFYLKPFKGARTIYRMKHTRLSVTWSLPLSSALFPATPCLKRYSPIILNSSTGSSSHLTCCLPWGCLCWGSACSPATPIFPPG